MLGIVRTAILGNSVFNPYCISTCNRPAAVYRTRMANSALKCRIIILIVARSLCNYNNTLMNFGQLYSNSCYTTFNIATLGSEALYLSHILAPQQMTYFLLNLPCKYNMLILYWDIVFRVWSRLFGCSIIHVVRDSFNTIQFMIRHLGWNRRGQTVNTKLGMLGMHRSNNNIELMHDTQLRLPTKMLSQIVVVHPSWCCFSWFMLDVGL